MRKVFFAYLLIVSLLPLLSFSQDIATGLNLYSEQFSPEKLHIQTDRSVYRKGESIFLKVYALGNNEMATLSKTVYIDWYDEKGGLLIQTQAPLLLAGAKASFAIPADYKYKTVSLKAYTRWMLNFDTAFVYTLSVSVSKSAVAVTDTLAQAIIPQVQIYPEGGFSVADVINRLAFKATDQLGNPVQITGLVKYGNQVILDSIETAHDGMGVFALNMKGEEIYSFDWKDASGHRGSLPLQVQKKSAAVLHVTTHDKKATFRIERNATAGDEFKQLHLLVHRNYDLRYKLDINMSSKNVVSSDVLLEDLPDGLVQFTLFNSNWAPVAERIIYLKSRSPKFFPVVSVLTKDLSKKGINQVEINVPDTFVSNMSVAVTELSFANTGGPTIFSDFLINSELKGKINNPSYYFTGDENPDTDDSSRSAHLDLVMLTNGHRRYDWEQISKSKLPVVSHQADTGYLRIRGKVISKRLLKSAEPISLNVIIEGKDSSRSTLLLPVDKNGQFEKSGFLFYDTVKLFYSINTSKLINNNVAFETGLMKGNERRHYFSIYIPDPTPVLRKEFIKSLPLLETFYTAQDEQLKSIKDALLKEVTIKSRVKTTKEILDDFYTSGMYSGEGNSMSFDVEGDIRAPQFQDIFGYLETKLPGFRVEYVTGFVDPMNPLRVEPAPVRVPRWQADNTGTPGQPALLLDEVPITVEAMSTVSVSSIAYVKAFRPPFLGSMLNGFSGVIAVYSKRGNSPVYSKDNSPGLNSFVMEGYTRFKEFIQPVYPDEISKEQPNYQPTVYWNPFILTDRNNPKFMFEFNNNDLSKKLCLVLEGINAIGQITRVVKVIE